MVEWLPPHPATETIKVPSRRPLIVASAGRSPRKPSVDMVCKTSSVMALKRC